MSNLRLNKKIKIEIEKAKEVASFLWEKGWAEKNAGNFSVNITHIVKDILTNPDDWQTFPLKKDFPLLKNNYFLISVTSSRMLDTAKYPEKYICIIRITDKSDEYQLQTLCDDCDENVKPTSELPTHLEIHQQLIRNNAVEKAVLHTHATEVIALSHLPMMKTSEDYTRLVWSMHPESIIFLPNGVGLVKYTMPGSYIIAEKTIEVMEKYNLIIWEKHGCISIATDLHEAFDLIDTVAKTARIYFDCKSTGEEPTGLTEEQLTELKELYGK